MAVVDRIVNGRTDLVLDIVRSGMPPDASDRDGVPLIRWCAYYGDVSAISFLIEAGASPELLGPNFDLNGAAFHGHWRLCEYLLELGASPTVPLEDTQETPLHAATSVPGRPEFEVVVDVLLRAGADPNARSRPGIESGCFMRDVRTAGETPLHRAAAFGSSSMIEALIAAGGDVELRDTHGNTPLSWASLHDRPDAILRLLLFGPHRIHPDRDSRSDHGHGVSAMQRHLLGKPGGDQA
ncbi:MAG: hypothetical protein HKN29_07045 [Rhodothermales bacterium]|nr:hypothetical protein [Rhodothermales bacterium]